MSSRTDVGLVAMRWVNVTQSSSACFMEGVILIWSAVPFSELFSGDKSPRPLGKPMQVWLSLPITCCISVLVITDFLAVCFKSF